MAAAIGLGLKRGTVSLITSTPKSFLPHGPPAIFAKYD